MRILGYALLCGTRSEWFCSRLSKELGVELIPLESKKFPDGESYVRIAGDVEGKDVVLAHSLSFPQNDSIWELLITMEALVDSGVNIVALYLPYLAYSRQDRAFLPGEPISVKALLQILSFMGAKALVTIDIHKEYSMKYFRGIAYNLIPVDPMAEKISERVSDPLIVAPDVGAFQRASAIAEKIGTDFIQLSKKRDLKTGEVAISSEGFDVSGRNVVIVDDIISTGGTVAKAASMLRDAGAKEVYVAVSHALMAGDAQKKLKEAGVASVFAANTLPPLSGVEYYDVTGIAAEKIREILG